jgi:hypothetical protein
MTVNPDDDALRVGDGSGSFRRHLPRRIRVTRALVDVVRHGPDKTLQRRELHELIPPLRGAFTLLTERRCDQKPWDCDAVLFRQGEQLGFLFGADLNLVTVHPAAVDYARRRRDFQPAFDAVARLLPKRARMGSRGHPGDTGTFVRAASNEVHQGDNQAAGQDPRKPPPSCPDLIAEGAHLFSIPDKGQPLEHRQLHRQHGHHSSTIQSLCANLRHGNTSAMV